MKNAVSETHRTAELDTILSVINTLPIPCLLFWAEEALLYSNNHYKTQAKFSLEDGLPAEKTLPGPWASLVKKVLQTDQSQRALNGLFAGLDNAFSVGRLEPVHNSKGVAVGALLSLMPKNNPGSAPDGNEERFLALINASTDVIYRMSEDWGEMRELIGRDFITDTAEADQHWMDKYIHPEDQGFVRKAFEYAIAHKTMFELEHRVLQTDGSIGWTFSRAVPILNNQGEITEWFGSAADITQRKRVEGDLREARDEMEAQRRLYDAITGSTPDLVYVIDLNYKFVYANNALLSMWGRSWEQSKGLGLLALGYEPWHAEMHEREIDEVAATKKPIRGEVSFPHATLGRRLYDYIFAPIFNEEGDVVLIAGITRDISDLKQAEEALRQSEEQFRTLTESLPQLIWTASPDGYCDFFNRQWYDFTGSTPDLSEGDGWFSYVHADYRNALYNAWKTSLKHGTPIVFEFLLNRKDGASQWFYVLGSPIYGQDGNISKWVGALTNIDGQKAVEGQLEKLAAEQTKELKRSNEDLLKFAHVASHDLKEPVRKIKTFSNRLLEDESTQLSASGKQFVEKIESAANRMYQMIEGVLRYSEMTNLQEDMVEIDLNQVIQQIGTDLEVTVQELKASILYHDLPTIKGVPVLIYQLFYNLVNNSFKFGRKDVPVVVNISSKLVSREGNLYAFIDVADNGIGFPQNFAESIFNTFTRLNPKDKYEGTGLGLALCKKIVERHRGSITANGVVNDGAVFHICLPVNQ